VVDCLSVSADERVAFPRHLFGYFTDHDYVQCEGCGMSLSRAEQETHSCDDERRARLETFQVRNEVAEFDRQFEAFLLSAVGRFAAYYAEHDRQRKKR
jgi:hypothetical protein